MNDLITVIIPAYNAEKYITACVESVVAQTYANLEIIIVNDGSTDQTGKLLDKLAMKDLRIKVIHQKNQGVSVARNAGWAIAQGNCIGFVDADDVVHRDMYEFLYHNLKKYDADISHCGFELVKADETIKFHDTGIILVQNSVDAIRELLTGIKVEPSACTKLYKRSVLEKVFFPTDIKINEDLLFNIEAFKNAEKIVFEDRTKYRYTYNPVSASRSSLTVEKVQNIYEVANRIKKMLTERELADAVNRFYTSKLLINLKSLKTENLFSSELAEMHRNELKNINTQKMGLRTRTLKSLLLDFPFLYDGFIFLYNRVFSKNQKWK